MEYFYKCPKCNDHSYADIIPLIGRYLKCPYCQNVFQFSSDRLVGEGDKYGPKKYYSEAEIAKLLQDSIKATIEADVSETDAPPVLEYKQSEQQNIQNIDAAKDVIAVAEVSAETSPPAGPAETKDPQKKNNDNHEAVKSIIAEVSKKDDLSLTVSNKTTSDQNWSEPQIKQEDKPTEKTSSDIVAMEDVVVKEKPIQQSPNNAMSGESRENDFLVDLPRIIEQNDILQLSLSRPPASEITSQLKPNPENITIPKFARLASDAIPPSEFKPHQTDAAPSFWEIKPSIRKDERK